MWFKSFSKVFYLTLIVSFFFLNNVVAQGFSPSASFEKVDSDKVCMVNDKFMGIEQIPVKADGKMYYGCCKNCIAKIQNNQNNVRFAKDPLTGETVDKADAYTVSLKDRTRKILYFKSEQNYLQFLKKLQAH